MRRCFAILVVLLLSVACYSQTFRGAINGTVTDQSGAVVANASVKATNNGTGVPLSTLSTSDGVFAFQDLPLGTYTIEVIASGFKSETINNVTVTAGTIYTLPVKLAVGSAGTTAVEVSAAALTLDTTTATLNDTLTDAAVQNIPLNGRDFSQLIAVAPGYGGYSVGGFGSLNGTRANQMNWQIDGTDNNDFWHNIPAVNQGGVSGIAGTVMPIDAIDEFSEQSQSNAETGRNAGGTINLTIKSGTNNIHGSAYYYNRNEFYAAASPFFAPTADFPKAPPLRNQNYGFTAGGPVIKDKAFWFVGFEKQNYIFGLTGLSTEPSGNPTTLTGGWIGQAAALLASDGGTPSPLSQTLLGTLWPSSIQNLPAISNNYFATVPGTGFSYNGVAKMDYNFNEKHHLSIHGFWGQGSQTQPPGASLALATASSNLGYYFEVAPIRIENYSAVLNSALSSRLSNQVLFGLSYFHQVFSDANSSFSETGLGLYTSPDALINGHPISGAPNIQIAGFDQVGITPPEGRTDVTGHLGDIVSYVTGKHQFRFGGEFRQGHVDEFYFRRSLGSFVFDGSATCGTTGDPTCALADFLAGDYASASIAVGDAQRKVVVNGFDLFGQDDWQITRKLNLNLGLRYDYIGPLHSGDKDLAVFIPAQGLKIQGNGINSIFPSDKNNFAPRLGFAYQPTANADLVVRGGVGIFYDQINMNPFLDFRPGGAGADGLQDNPIGPHPVDNYSIGAGQWASNTYIFPGLTTCPTLSGCGTSLFNVYSVGQNFRTPYFYNYNLQVEKGFGNGAAVLQVGYVGSAGHKLSVMDSITLTPEQMAQFPNAGKVLQLNSVGNSNYNSLQTTFRIRSWHGLSSQFGYTWAHELDTMTEYRGSIQFDPTNPKLDYGSGDFDTRQNFTAFFTYDVPGSSHGPKLLTHGWQVSSLMTFHGGQPFNFDGGTQRPGISVIGDPFSGVSHSFNLAAAGGEPWVNPQAFCVPGTTLFSGAICPGTVGVGNLSRNKFYGPGFEDVDLSVIKNIPLTERFKLQLRAEMFNLFNHKNLATGAGSVGGSSCTISSTCPTGFTGGIVGDTIGDFNGAPGLGPGEPFNLQIAAKIIF